MYPDDPATIDKLGETGVRLLRDVGEWVTRRKERISILDDRLARRYMSVDFELPDWVKPVSGSGATAVCYAPLFMLQKGSDDLPQPSKILIEPPPYFAAFDLRGPSGEALSLPPRTWNAKVSIRALHFATQEAMTKVGATGSPKLWDWLEEFYSHICTSERNEAVGLVDELRSTGLSGLAPEAQILRLLLAKSETVDWLLEACAKSSIAMVPLVGQAARRGIVKLSYNEQIARFLLPPRGRKRIATYARLGGARLGWTGTLVWIDTPFIGAGNYHVEITAPPGLDIYDAGLLQVPEQAEPVRHSDHQITLSRVPAISSEVHLYAPDAERLHGALSWVRLRVSRQELLTTSVVVGCVITAVLWINLTLAGEIKRSPMGIPELLLLFPGAVAAYVTRPGPHRLTTRMLAFARFTLLLVALTPYAAALSLALATHGKHGHIASDAFKPWLLGLAVVASVGTLALILARLLPVPEIRRQHFARWMRWPLIKRQWRSLSAATRKQWRRLRS